MKKYILLIALSAIFFMSANAQNTYTKVTNVNDLEDGYGYLIVGKDAGGDYYVMGEKTSNSVNAVPVTDVSGVIEIIPASVNNDGNPHVLSLNSSTGGTWTIFDTVRYIDSGRGYFSPRSQSMTGNGLRDTTFACLWSITIGANGVATITATSPGFSDRNTIRFNETNSPKIFSAYASGQSDVYIYKGPAATQNTNPSLSVPTITNVASGENVIINFTINNYTDEVVRYTIGTEAPVCPANNPIILTDLADGNYTITLELVDDCSDVTPIKKKKKTFTVGSSTPPDPTVTPIATIQQNGVAGTSYTIEGIVTFVQIHVGGSNDGQQDGYYVQDARTPYSGIYVYEKNNTPAVGNTVKVTGKFKVYYGMNELESVSSYTVTNANTQNWEPMLVDCATAATAQYQSCYVRMENVKILDAQANGNYGISDNGGSTEMMLLNKTHQLQGQYITVNATYHPAGVIDYSYDNWRILPSTLSYTVAIDETMLTNINIFPNPATTHFTVQCENTINNLTIINSIGQTVVSIENVADGQEINLNSLNNGLYLIQFRSGNNVKTEKLIIK